MTKAYIRTNIFKGHIYEDHNYIVVVEDDKNKPFHWTYIAIGGAYTKIGAMAIKASNKNAIILENK